MPINADKPHLWKPNVQASVDQYNAWFMVFAPAAYRERRSVTSEAVKQTLLNTNDLHSLTPEILQTHPQVLVTFRRSTAPPIARDRLIGLAGASPNLVHNMEEKGRIPPLMKPAALQEHLQRICTIIEKLLDRDIFPWLAEQRRPTDVERNRSSSIVADRLCGSSTDNTKRGGSGHCPGEGAVARIRISECERQIPALAYWHGIEV